MLHDKVVLGAVQLVLAACFSLVLPTLPNSEKYLWVPVEVPTATWLASYNYPYYHR